jgi:hypothetical protein
MEAKTTTKDDSRVENTTNKGRYSVECIQSSNFKHVPFEQIDYAIYKASTNTVAFTTTEERMPLWIEALRARYQDGLHINTNIKDDSTKCDKVTIHLISTKSSINQNLITITALINNGRIQVQGRSYKEWGNEEFPRLLAIINSSPAKTNPTKDLEAFVELITINQKPTTMEKDDHTIEDKSEPDINTNALNDEPMFSIMKSSLASLEADFVLFKQATQMSINDLTVQLDNKDGEINNLKNEITLLKTTNLNQKQSICDLTLKQSQIEDELKKLKNKHKSLEKKNTDQLQKLQTLNKENIQTNEETTSQIQPNITVLISNSFGTLKDNLNQPDDEIQRDEMSTSQNTLLDDTKDQPPQPNKVNNGETIILCDSNGRHINPNLLCPGSKTSYIRCPTLSDANKIMEQTTFTNPKTFLLHCGTNDLESNQSDEEITGHLKSTVTTISSKHPESKVIISTLLPRKDNLNERTKNINQSLEETFSASKIYVVKHDNIKTKDLRDKKHLNTIGVKRFALNLKRAYFGHSPQNADKTRKSYNHPRKFRWQSNQQTNTTIPPFHQNHTTNHQHPNEFHTINNPYTPFFYNRMPFNQHPPHKSTSQTAGNRMMKQEEEKLPEEMVQLIKLLHTRYVN